MAYSENPGRSDKDLQKQEGAKKECKRKRKNPGAIMACNGYRVAAKKRRDEGGRVGGKGADGVSGVRPGQRKKKESRKESWAQKDIL